MELGLESGLSAFVLPAVYLGLTTSRLLMAFVRVPMMKYMRATQPLGGVCLAVAVLSGSPVVSLVMIFLGVFAIGPVIPFTLNLAGREDEKKRFMITIVCHADHDGGTDGVRADLRQGPRAFSARGTRFC